MNSDSEPSDDNLEQEQIMKLIPKKWGKRKYLRGIEEKKKAPSLPPQPEKKLVKKPKATMMPCHSASRKVRENSQTNRMASELF